MFFKPTKSSTAATCLMTAVSILFAGDPSARQNLVITAVENSPATHVTEAGLPEAYSNLGYRPQIDSRDSLKIDLYASEQDSEKIIILIELGEAYRWANVDTAKSYFSRGYELAKNIKSKLLQAKTKTALARLEYDDGNFDSSLQLGIEVLELLQGLNNEVMVADVYVGVLGPVYIEHGRNEEAKQYLNRAKDIYSVSSQTSQRC